MSHTAPAGTTSPLKMGVPIPNAKLGMWLFLGTEIMFFTAFIGSYIVLRIGSPGWPTDTHVTHIKVGWGALNTFVLIVSSYCVVLAHEAMHARQFRKATNFVAMTTILACFFLGIKSYEYYGKFSHDILPGRIAETDQQALEKLVGQLETASGVLALEDKANHLTHKLAAVSGNDDLADSLQKELDETLAKTEELKPLRLAFQPLAADISANRGTSVKGAEQAGELVTKAETLLAGFHEPTDAFLKETLGADFTNGLSAEQKSELKAEFATRFAGLEVPSAIPFGNLFASTYFIMTGFHAIHVLVGMLLFGIILLKGFTGQLGAADSVFVENSGLYWHFVDLVWIFLFPLIYIV